MKHYPDEGARLDALRQLNLLDTPASESFDRITRMAAQIFGLPISAVSLTDHDRQWFKSRVGIDHCTLPRHQAPCARVAEHTAPLVVPDLLADPAYADSPLAGSGARFYAGAPLVTREGFGLGALCVVGTTPRQASDLEMAALTDLAAMVMAQIELQHAFGRVDPSSGLPNRHQFVDDLTDLARDHVGERRLAVVVDLATPEQVSGIIRVLGPGRLDEMVKDAARELRSQLPAGHIGYHVAPTQFAFLDATRLPVADALAMLEQRMATLRQSAGARTAAATVIGVAPVLLGRTSPDDALRFAHNAAQDARDAGRAVGFHSSLSDERHRRRFRLLQDFGRTLAHTPEDLRVVVQPRIDLATGACVSAEVLLRWRHPDLGDVSPAEFMPIVELSPLARPATQWVIDTALAQAAAWAATGPAVPLSINVSATNLEEHDFAARVTLRMHQHRLRPELIELEMTESAVMNHTGPAIEQLGALAEAGFRIAIDDFGTGYSSLSYLQQLPASVVKIDQGFIRDLTAGEREQALVRSMIRMAHELGYRVVAEGVETVEAAALLATMGCDEAQGYWYARPMEVDAFPAWYGRHVAHDRRRAH